MKKKLLIFCMFFSLLSFCFSQGYFCYEACFDQYQGCRMNATMDYVWCEADCRWTDYWDDDNSSHPSNTHNYYFDACTEYCDWEYEWALVYCSFDYDRCMDWCLRDEDSSSQDG